jgi:salicylate hydroxylase
MAVEDGAVLGTIIGGLKGILDGGSDQFYSRQETTASALKLYENMRKARTTKNVLGAVQNRILYHMPDGPEQRERDKVLGSMDLDTVSWKWANGAYQLDLLGYDAIKAAESSVQAWGRIRQLAKSSHL